MRHTDIHLTDRETDVLILIAHEYTISEIADKLYLSTHTIISHRRNLKKKLVARNTAGMIYKAFVNGVLQVKSLSDKRAVQIV